MSGSRHKTGPAMIILTFLLVATLFGGMVFFSFGFAPVLFAQLSSDQVRPLLRGTFPYYYLVVIGLSAMCAVAAIFTNAASGLVISLLGFIAVSTIAARQVLMPMINAATDAGNQKRFAWLHGGSVVLQLVQIGLCGWALVLFLFATG